MTNSDAVDDGAVDGPLAFRDVPDVSTDPPDAGAAPPSPSNVHDTLFYKTFSQPELAAAQLKSVVSKEVATAIDWNSLTLMPHRFVDPNLRNHASDVLYSAKVQGKKTLVHFLFEHSSGPKSFELLQVLRYQVRIWEKVAEELVGHPDERHLPPIVTVILHHSSTGFRGCVRFQDYFGLDDELHRIFAPYLLDFGVIVDDISKEDAADLPPLPWTPRYAR